MGDFLSFCGLRLDRSTAQYIYTTELKKKDIPVPDPSKGVCADPVNGDAILGKGGPDPQSENKERQLSPDKGGEKT